MCLLKTNFKIVYIDYSTQKRISKLSSFLDVNFTVIMGMNVIFKKIKLGQERA